MGLDDFTPSDIPEGWPKSSEVSEKFKEAAKKAAAGIKRVQKDEKRAKKYDTILASFLVQIIKNPKYDFLLQELFKALDNGYSSNFLLWLLSLIYLPISDKIREISTKNIISFWYQKTPNTIEFDDEIHEEIKNRINLWIEDIIDIVSIEYSSLQIQHMLEIYGKKDEEYIQKFSCKVFVFFFAELNIHISEKKAMSYIEFILEQIFAKMKTISTEEI